MGRYAKRLTGGAVKDQQMGKKCSKSVWTEHKWIAIGFESVGCKRGREKEPLRNLLVSSWGGGVGG